MDCLEGMKNLKSNLVDCILTDPPYEIDYNNRSKELAKLGKSSDKQIERDKSFVDKISSYSELANEFYRLLKHNSHCFIFCAGSQIGIWQNVMVEAGFKSPQVLVWKKNRTTFDMTNGYKFPVNNEFLLFFQKGWKKLNGYKISRNRFRSVLEFKRGDTTFHSCSKPLDLLRFIIKLSTFKEDVVLDGFIGGGSTAVACKELGRDFIGFELSEEYCEVANNRLKQTGLIKWFVKAV